MPNCSRREFIKRVGGVTLVTGLAGSVLSACARMGMTKKGLERNLNPESYPKLTRGWDPVYGPSIQEFSRYGGRGDFQGHIRGGAAPGVDYDAVKGTPLVPPMVSYLRQSTRDDNGALYLFLVDIFNPAYRIAMAHLDEIFVDDRYLVEGEVMRFLGEGVKALGRGDIVALSGNSGFGPREYGYVQPPHLHLSFHYWDYGKRTLEPLDPEKYGAQRHPDTAPGDAAEDPYGAPGRVDRPQSAIPPGVGHGLYGRYPHARRSRELAATGDRRGSSPPQIN